MAHPLITISHLGKIFPKQEARKRLEVFHDLNLTIHKGEFLTLLGPSGCGKSTLLRILAKLDHATSGSVTYSEDFSFDKMSFVFQNFGLLPWLTVFQNIELGLIGRKVPPHERAKEIALILEQFGLHGFKDRFPQELSGGMRQRVGLARAFITNPDIIFLDEPFSELDFFTAATLRKILMTMWQERGITIVMVSHYIEDAVAMGDRIAVFSDRPGNIVGIIPNNLTRPRDPRSKEFFDLEDTIFEHMKNHEHPPARK